MWQLPLKSESNSVNWPHDPDAYYQDLNPAWHCQFGHRRLTFMTKIIFYANHDHIPQNGLILLLSL